MKRALLLVWVVIAIAAALPPAARQLRVLLEQAIGPLPGRTDRLRIFSIRQPLPDPMPVAHRFPNDPDMQLAALNSRAGLLGAPGQAELRRLVERFPQSRVLRAALVSADLDRVSVQRDELSDPAHALETPNVLAGPAVGAARLLLKDASEAGRLDPANARYPMCRSYACLALRDDAAAARELASAAPCTTWNDYRSDAAQARLRLVEAQVGPATGLELTAVQAVETTLFPGQFARLREYARCISGMADRMEASGKLAEAMALRTSLTRCAGLMRRDSTMAIGSMVGSAIEAIAQGGSATHLRKYKTATNEAERQAALARRRALARDRYLAVGRPDLAAALVEVNDAQDQARDVFHRGLDRDPFLREIAMPYAGLALTLGGLLMMAWCLACLPRSRAGRIVVACATAALAGRVIMRGVQTAEPIPIGLAEAAGVGLGLLVTLAPVGICAIVAAVRHKRSGVPFGDGLRAACLLCAPLLAVVAAGGLWMAQHYDTRVQSTMRQMMRNESVRYADLAGRPWPTAVMPPWEPRAK